MAGIVLRQAEFHVLDVAEPSAITFVSPQVGFLVFSDASAQVWRVLRPPVDAAEPVVEPLRHDDDALRDVEGATYDPETGTVRVLSEVSRRVYEFDLTLGPNDSVALGNPRRHARKLKRVQRRPNSGYEGFTTLPGRLSPDGKKWNVAVNERKPRRVCFFDPETLKSAGHAKLPARAKPPFPDLSSLVFAENGSLFLLSDEGCRFGEFSLERSNGAAKARWKLRLVKQTPIATQDLPLAGAERLQPEGMTFDERGDLWIVAEANALLIHFVRD